MDGKTADMCYSQFEGKEHVGYPPKVDGLSRSDYIAIEVCLECGQVQGKWPQPDPEEFEK